MKGQGAPDSLMGTQAHLDPSLHLPRSPRSVCVCTSVCAFHSAASPGTGESVAGNSREAQRHGEEPRWRKQAKTEKQLGGDPNTCKAGKEDLQGQSAVQSLRPAWATNCEILSQKSQAKGLES